MAGPLAGFVSAALNAKPGPGRRRIVYSLTAKGLAELDGTANY